MPEPDVIPPALTPAEWDAGDVDRPHLWTQTSRGLLVCRTPGDRSVLADENDLPALIALANAARPDGDPGKITRADVEALREWADAHRFTEDRGEFFDGLAAKLAALLPPDA